jgi:transposase
MAFEYLPVDRAQRFLLPPDMGEWLAEGHLVWFVIDVVDRVDCSVLHARGGRGGVGRRGYDPEMLLALLLYAYCCGVRSSRQIERLCEVDVAYRVLAGGAQPDHSTIARFRQDHEAAAQGLFVEVLAVCAQAGLARVGVVAVDGTKVAGDASVKANRTGEQLAAAVAARRAEVAAMFAQAAATDAGEDRLFGAARGDELPAELARRDGRLARLDAAAAQVAAQRVEVAQREAWAARQAELAPRGHRPAGRPPRDLEVDLAQAAVAAEEANAAARARRRAERETAAGAAGRKLAGARPAPPQQEHRGLRKARARLAKANARAAAGDGAEQGKRGKGPKRPGPPRANVTDPDSRLMHGPHGWVQGYNAQAAVSEDGIVLAAEVTQDHNDVRQCQPMLAATQTNMERAAIDAALGVVLFDAGYLSEDNLTAAGPDRLIATGKTHHLRRRPPTEAPPPPDATPAQAMAHRLATDEGRTLYAKRQHTVEPVFGETKHLRGFRRFSRRGLPAVNAEWKLQMTVHNLLKAFRHHALATG